MWAGNRLIIDMPWITAAVLVSIRLSAMLLMTPVLPAASVPAPIRILLIFVFALMLTLGLPGMRFPAPLTFETLAGAGIAELGLGAMMGLGILMAFSAFAVAGRLLDVQIGYGIAQVFDPVTRRQTPILSMALNQLAVVVFFASNGHHVLLRGLAYSFERFPVGRVFDLSASLPAMFKQMAGLFTLGFALVAPVVFCILLAEFALGILTRNLPQMHVFALAHSIKIVVGLSALSIWLAGAGGVLDRIYRSIFQFWEAAFR